MENDQEKHLDQDGNNSLGNVSPRKVEVDGKSKLRRRRGFVETKTDGGTWLQDNSNKCQCVRNK
jgi:hypothetical protein